MSTDLNTGPIPAPVPARKRALELVLTLAVLVAALMVVMSYAAHAEPLLAGDTTVYVYTDDPSQVAALCAQAQADWGPADHCRVLPKRYEDTSVGEAADIAGGGW